MTPAQAAWLRKLRDEGPQNGFANLPTSHQCFKAGWTMNAIPNPSKDQISAAGLAALAQAPDGEGG